MSAAVNIAVIGLGRMGRIYADAVASVPGTRLLAAADPSGQARAHATARGVPHVAEAPEALLALPGLDAVIIASPTSTHHALVVAAARAGKAIFCEKPLALTLAETHGALDAVARAGVLLQVGFMRRFDAGYRHARDLIERGEIGRPVTFKSIGRDPFCPSAAFADPMHSGGLILDMGIHDFDLARWLMGSEVERVTAEGALLACDELRTVGDIDNAVINLRFAGGALGNVEVSRNAAYGYDIRTEVLGTDGAVRIGGEQLAPTGLLARNGRPPGGAYLIERFGDAYRAQIRHFVTCLQHGRPPAVTGADALAAFELGLAATYAARTGQPVAVAAVRAGWAPAAQPHS